MVLLTQGNALRIPMADESVPAILWYNRLMRDSKGRFVKGQSASPETQFKKGEHWRPKKAHWNKEWLENEYITKQRSMSDIAEQMGVTENAIHYWARKHGIKTRSMQEIRSIKHWGSEGESNGMYGRRGADNPRWKGGVTPERQAFYTSREWIDAIKIVWKRDQAICQRCGKKQVYKERKFHIHHIVPFADARDLRCDPNNLVLLCHKCHSWVHSKKNNEGLFIDV